jgi:soluble lytic murein transglycosylase-like protein
MGKVIAACLLMAAQNYSVPPAVLLGIYQVESGRVGQEVGPNQNGSYDLGPMQINTLWVPELADLWGVNNATARRWIKDDPCTNVGVAAWILRRHYDETGNLSQAIAHYHSRTPRFGSVYKKKVLASMHKHGLIKVNQKD